MKLPRRSTRANSTAPACSNSVAAAPRRRAQANSGRSREIFTLEVDRIQHVRNPEIVDLPSVKFRHGSAEAIPADHASFDIVPMFKSLQHVPGPHMDAALGEIARVLRPGGLALISEPLYAGDLNEVFRLFHDENAVRDAALAGVRRAVDGGRLALQQQPFFNTRSFFEDFAAFDRRMIRVTHTDHRLDPELYRRVREKFESYLGPDGATFLVPQRVDLLRKAA